MIVRHRFLLVPLHRHLSRAPSTSLKSHVQIKPPSRLRLHSTATVINFHPESSPPPPPIKRSFFRLLVAAFFYTSLGLTMATVASLPKGGINGILKPPTDEETLSLFNPEPETFAAEIDAYIHSHPLIKSLFEDEAMIPSRPHLKIPPVYRPMNLTGGTLLGEGKVEVPPLTFTTKDGSKFISIQYLGSALCGHPGLVHGGLLATLLDEGLARCCFPALPNKVGVTASLKIDYRVPCKADQYVILRAETTKVEGRKAWVKGWLETLPAPEEWEMRDLEGNFIGKQPVKLVEAEALFVEPKNAATIPRVYSSQSDSAVASARNSPPKA